MKSKALQCVSKIEKSKLSQNGLWLKGTPGDHLVHICCSKQSQLEQAAQDHVQLDFEYGQGWRLHHFSGQPVVVFSHSCSKGWGGGGEMSLCLSGIYCISRNFFSCHLIKCRALSTDLPL